MKHSISQALQRAALGGLGGVFLLAGVGFLTAALYLFLLTQTDPMTACLVIGGGFAGVGLILVGVSKPGAPPKTEGTDERQPDMSQSTMTPVILAFLDGLQQGMAARQSTNGPKS